MLPERPYINDVKAAGNSASLMSTRLGILQSADPPYSDWFKHQSHHFMRIAYCALQSTWLCRRNLKKERIHSVDEVVISRIMLKTICLWSWQWKRVIFQTDLDLVTSNSFLMIITYFALQWSGCCYENLCINTILCVYFQFKVLYIISIYAFIHEVTIPPVIFNEPDCIMWAQTSQRTHLFRR